MTVAITPLTPVFAARIDGVDIARPLSEGDWAAIRAALDEHSVLVFRGQSLDDDAQVAFSRRFGNLEVTLCRASRSRRRGEQSGRSMRA